MISIVGPTATGKSQVAAAVAELLGAEIVNADAYAVYRGMNIGTAKPSLDERAGIPHHLVDVLDIDEPISVALYQQVGRAALAGLAARARPAVVVGGSGLYVRGLLDDLRFPGSDPAIRARWEQRLSDLGPAGLHEVLRQRDAAAAAAILPSNGRRIVRALEVGELTGQPFQAVLPKAGPPLVAHRSFGLDLPSDLLDERISARVDAMLAAGWIEEVARLRNAGLGQTPTARMALGYQTLLDHLDGQISAIQARAQIVTATCRYARKQRKWFRADHRTQWLPAESAVLSTAASILALLPHDCP
ncbi:MAG: tRNA (adenosine(37)-N6)-dimethylallyltransferase MiaA [Candidatus Nanopelagicales bacterium]